MSAKMGRRQHHHVVHSHFHRKVLSVMVILCSLFHMVFGFDDKDALLELKSAITEDPFGFTSNWNPKHKDPCSWFGVTCETFSNRVTALSLSSFNTTATSACPLVFSNLKGGNFNFTLMFPCFDTASFSHSSVRKLRGNLSPAVGKLTELRVLSLGFNEFTGQLPLEIGKLKSLEVLDLGFNAFHGPIPITLRNCTELKVINLSGNRLNGTISGIFGSFSGLQLLALSYNMLSGWIPEELSKNCAALEHLHLAGNSIARSIPSNLGSCSELRSLILSSNLLQDEIPASLGKLAKLEALDLSRNFLSAAIPPELGNCSQLKLIVLKNNYGSMLPGYDFTMKMQPEGEGITDSNYFADGLPDGIVELPNLRILWAPSVNLEGSFPQNWESCSSLVMLNLAENYFHGQIPVSLKNCKSMYYLDLSSNNLTGVVAEELSVPCMGVFNISRNLLQGDFPSFSTKECSNISVNLSSKPVELLDFYSYFFYTNAVLASAGPYSFPLNGLAVLHDFSNNLFTGQVPPFPVALNSFSGRLFYGLWLNGNDLAGNMSAYSLDPCHSLDGLIFDIGDNRIVGEMPSDIGSSCKCMKSLSLAGNQLVGLIPQPLCNLNSLVNLNLSNNKLQGPIPSYLGQMKDLKFLILSDNEFTGMIPLELAKLSSLEVLELSSNHLSGQIPANFAKLGHLNVLKLDHNNLTGGIPTGFSNLTSLSEFNVSFNNLSGPIPANSNLMQCENLEGNPNLQSCPTGRAPTEWEQQHSGNISQQEGDTPSGSLQSNSSPLSPIEIAAITSASIIIAVLIALIILLYFMKKFACTSLSGQRPGRKEVVTCNSIGVELTYENVVRATGGFNVQNCIGSGGFGATYKAEINSGVVVAVKRLSVGRFQGVQQFAAEIRTLGRVQHPNLVTLIGYHVSESEMFLIYNYLPGGNLERFIQDRPRRTEWSMLHKIALDIARALAYLHDECVPRVLHRDIKPSNILLDNNLNAYLSDFGLARLLGTSETHATTDVAGTFGYVAPEYAMTCRVSDKADVYSYGVVLLELISDKKALDPSFSSYGNGFNIVGWASMLLRQGRASEFFTAGLWDSGPHDDLIESLHLAIMCTGESLSSRPSMRQVAQRLKRIQPPTS